MPSMLDQWITLTLSRDTATREAHVMRPTAHTASPDVQYGNTYTTTFPFQIFLIQSRSESEGENTADRTRRLTQWRPFAVMAWRWRPGALPLSGLDAGSESEVRRVPVLIRYFIRLQFAQLYHWGSHGGSPSLFCLGEIQPLLFGLFCSSFFHRKLLFTSYLFANIINNILFNYLALRLHCIPF